MYGVIRKRVGNWTLLDWSKSTPTSWITKERSKSTVTLRAALQTLIRVGCNATETFPVWSNALVVLLLCIAFPTKIIQHSPASVEVQLFILSMSSFVSHIQNNLLKKAFSPVSVCGYQWMYFSFCTIVSSTPYHPHYKEKKCRKKVFARDAIRDGSTVNWECHQQISVAKKWRYSQSDVFVCDGDDIDCLRHGIPQLETAAQLPS